jgi:protein-disulfide isomerase/uncharacterized membrane protein
MSKKRAKKKATPSASPAQSESPPVASLDNFSGLERPSPGLFYYIALGLAIVGLIPTTLLVIESYQLALQPDSASGICGAIGMSCAGALTSETAKLGGWTLSYVGFGWYAGMALFLLLGLGCYLLGLLPSLRFCLTLAVLAGVVSTGYALYLVSQFFTAEYDPCPLCLATHLTTIFFTGAVALALLYLKEPTPSDGSTTVATPIEGTGSPVADASQQLVQAIVTLGSVVFAGLIVMTIHLGELKAHHAIVEAEYETLRNDPTVKQQLMLKAMRELPEDVKTRLLQSPRPGKGDADAPVRVLKVFDFECPKCRTMHVELKEQMKDYGELVRLEYVHLPLSNECNPFFKENLHPYSCRAHLASIAAEKQGKFLEYTDLLFEPGRKLETTDFAALADELGMDAEQFEIDLNSVETNLLLQRDLELVYKMGVYGTPRFIVNNKVLPAGVEAEDIFATAIEEVESSP